MRSILLGFLCFLLPCVALAQARGEVQSIGFGGHYRPGTWTPMVVKLVPTTGAHFTGRLEVVQEDLDRDQVIFTRQITLDPAPENGTANEERFWMYFMPQPTKDRGELDSTLSLAELSDRIKVRLCTESGKELVKLPITQTIQPIESLRAGNGSDPRGKRAVLIVHNDHYPTSFREFQMMTGMTEDIWIVSTRETGTGLPDNVIGYDSIDSILWCDADSSQVKGEQLTALEQFVKRGGKLVISQDTATNQWQRNNTAFPLLMPVTVRGVEERDDHAMTLRLLADIGFTPKGQITPEIERDWDKVKGPFRYAIADPKPGATVVLWQTIDPDGEPLFDVAKKPIPFIVRQSVGAGSVTWVAQDLGDKNILGSGAGYEEDQAPRQTFTTRGWPKIWDKIFDWKNEPTLQASQSGQNDPKTNPYYGGTTWELGRSYLEYMDLPSRSAALIGIAVLFFVVYWIGAGPGSYFVLSKKGKSALSWFTFAAIAIGATALTAGIVKLVLRGSPELQHVTLVRMAPGEPAWIQSQFGLYIPRDGYQKIELKDAAPGSASYIRPFNLHPAFNVENAEFPARQEYFVPVKELHEKDQEPEDPKSIRVPYRSTLKKFQAEWIGNPPGLTGGIDGTAALSNSTPKITGDLINNTGHDLRMVYFVVHHPHADEVSDDKGNTEYFPSDLLLYVSYWPKGSKVSLTKQFETPKKDGSGGAPRNIVKDGGNPILTDPKPNGVIVYQGRISRDNRLGDNWADVWLGMGGFRNSGGYVDNREYTEKEPLTPISFPILSFFDRLPVTRNKLKSDKSIDTTDRANFLRRGLRQYDMSSAISGGSMAIIAVSATREEELPFPLDVQGDQIKGKGIIYYQFVVPVDRSVVNKAPTSQPTTTQPATQPSKGKVEI